MKIAFFHFEANLQIGAGHAMRSSVLADLLLEKGWRCETVTTQKTYEFIPALNRFTRHDPDAFYQNPVPADLSVFDNYAHHIHYENHYQPYSTKRLVIEDLPNRQHSCDILLDQTYGRLEAAYSTLVPTHCQILAGCDYALLRSEFSKLRSKALDKRKKTQEVKRILISMGGADPNNQTQKALELIADTGFMGAIDIVLGFQAPHQASIQEYINKIPNPCILHSQANMAQLYYEADLAIGAAGGSVWERLCLGLPQFLFQTADNQAHIFEQCSAPDFKNLYQTLHEDYANYCSHLTPIVDGLGANKVIHYMTPQTEEYL